MTVGNWWINTPAPSTRRWTHSEVCSSLFPRITQRDGAPVVPRSTLLGACIFLLAFFPSQSYFLPLLWVFCGIDQSVSTAAFLVEAPGQNPSPWALAPACGHSQQWRVDSFLCWSLGHQLPPFLAIPLGHSDNPGYSPYLKVSTSPALIPSQTLISS